MPIYSQLYRLFESYTTTLTPWRCCGITMMQILHCKGSEHCGYSDSTAHSIICCSCLEVFSL